MERRKLKPSRLMRETRRIVRNGYRAARLLDAMPADYPGADDDIAEREGCMFIGNRERWWRTCPERACRRARACLSPRITCSRALLLRRKREAVPQGVEVGDKPLAGR